MTASFIGHLPSILACVKHGYFATSLSPVSVNALACSHLSYQHQQVSSTGPFAHLPFISPGLMHYLRTPNHGPASPISSTAPSRSHVSSSSRRTRSSNPTTLAP